MILDGAALDRLLHAAETDPRTYLQRFYPELSIPPLDRVATQTVPLVAKVNHSQWIASCPCGAKGVPAPGGVVWMAFPLVWCVRCENASVGGGWRPVLIPPEAEREAIETVLSLRPRIETRNWETGESVEDLMAENLAHGIPVTEAA